MGKRAPKALRRGFLYFILASLIALAMMFTVFIRTYVDASAPGTRAHVVAIPKGSSVISIAGKLAEARIIDHPKMFRLMYYMLAYGKPLKAGEYEFDPGVTPRDVLLKLIKGDIHYRSLTIPEGRTVQEILQAVSKAEGLTGEVPIDINEGDLLPETYAYTYGESRAALVERMALAHIAVLENAWNARAEGLPIDSKAEAMILASIVEKETGVDGERGQVAAVYINRLRKGMKLQADPTVVYGITLGKRELGRELTRKDLKTPTSYNTYARTGLPPTPICNPGKASIEAVLNPPSSEMFYFVANGTGGHNFAATLEEHNRNVRAWRKFKKGQE